MAGGGCDDWLSSVSCSDVTADPATGESFRPPLPHTTENKNDYISHATSAPWKKLRQNSNLISDTLRKYTRGVVKEGSYRGIVVGTVKEQLLARARLEEKGNGKVSVLVVGGSQMGRIAGEMERIGGEVVRVHN